MGCLSYKICPIKNCPSRYEVLPGHRRSVPTAVWEPARMTMLRGGRSSQVCRCVRAEHLRELFFVFVYVALQYVHARPQQTLKRLDIEHCKSYGTQFTRITNHLYSVISSIIHKLRLAAFGHILSSTTRQTSHQHFALHPTFIMAPAHHSARLGKSPNIPSCP